MESYIPLTEGTKIDVQDLFPAKDTFVTIGDVAATTKIVSLLDHRNKQFDIRFGNDVAYGDLRENPTILIGAHNNAWTLTMTENLRYAFDGHTGIVDRTDPQESLVRHDGLCRGLRDHIAGFKLPDRDDRDHCGRNRACRNESRRRIPYHSAIDLGARQDPAPRLGKEEPTDRPAHHCHQSTSERSGGRGRIQLVKTRRARDESRTGMPSHIYLWLTVSASKVGCGWASERRASSPSARRSRACSFWCGVITVSKFLRFRAASGSPAVAARLNHR